MFEVNVSQWKEKAHNLYTLRVSTKNHWYCSATITISDNIYMDILALDTNTRLYEAIVSKNMFSTELDSILFLMEQVESILKHL